ncbi:MAG: phage baseplate assembly protein V [Alphaproteobacteria bacterium]|nr:phage baseplate assembly protein V [Alphaproteobacteria bacterium]
MDLPPAITRTNLSYGQVTEVGDPDGKYRVKVKIHSHFDAEHQAYELWARVAVPVGGDGYGMAFMPDVGDEVVIGFIAGDMNRPVVIGSLYHGGAMPADEPVDGDAVKRWTITGHQGTRVAIDESESPTVTLETPGGVKVEITDDGSKVTCTNGSSTVTLEPAEVSVETGGTVKVQASQVEVTSPMVTIDAALAKFSGVVKCDVLQTNTVISTTYTPGAGNVW